jgi:hypothetical protein
VAAETSKVRKREGFRMPTVQMLAGVAWPLVESPCLMIAPAPMKPIPVTTPCKIFAL